MAAETQRADRATGKATYPHTTRCGSHFVRPCEQPTGSQASSPGSKLYPTPVGHFSLPPPHCTSPGLPQQSRDRPRSQLGPWPTSLDGQLCRTILPSEPTESRSFKKSATLLDSSPFSPARCPLRRRADLGVPHRDGCSGCSGLK